jgi:hypothetical protein
MKSTIFSCVTPLRLLVIQRRFKGKFCHLLQGRKVFREQNSSEITIYCTFRPEDGSCVSLRDSYECLQFGELRVGDRIILK